MTFDFDFALSIIIPIAKKIPMTMYLTIISMFWALALGCVFAYVQTKNILVLKQIIIGICSFIKGVPLIVQLFFCYVSLPYALVKLNFLPFCNFDLRDPPFTAIAVIALSLNYSAYMCDVVMTSFAAVDAKQMEAGASIGMSAFATLRTVIIPQAAIISLPNMSNYFMAMLKATSMVYMVAVTEMLGEARSVAAETFQFFEAYIVAAALYWILCIVVEKLLKIMEKKLSKFLPSAA